MTKVSKLFGKSPKQAKRESVVDLEAQQKAQEEAARKKQAEADALRRGRRSTLSPFTLAIGVPNTDLTKNG